MASETNVQDAIWQALGKLRGTVLFRLNSGIAWVGHGKPEWLQGGALLLHAARPMALGLALFNRKPVVGQADLYGWRSITITPDMVGKRVAVVCSIECKKTTGGRTSSDQKHWLEQVRRAGGIAGVANSPEEAIKIVESYQPVSPDLAD